MFNRPALSLLPLALAISCNPQRTTASSTLSDHTPAVANTTLGVQWHHGVPACDSGNNDPPLQIFHYDADTIIMRQNICLSPEAPFLYLLFGTNKALLLDTGDVDDATAFPLRETVQSLLAEHATAKGQAVLPLVVAHTHSHGDHTTGDPQFVSQPGITLVDLGRAAVSSFFGFASWNSAPVPFDLGGRVLDVIPIPGHLTDHIAMYDHRTTNLLTGDSLYPGRLYVQAGHWQDYQASIARLWTFMRDKPVAHVLGAHIELTQTPRVDYPFQQTNRPDERALELTLNHLKELNTALQVQTTMTCDAHADFIIWPLDANPSCEVVIHHDSQ